MTFKPGQSGNPAGRAVGSRNKKTLAAEAALFEHAQELVDDLVRRAKNGEPAAMRLAMERILPTGRGRPLPIELPPVRSTEDAQVAAGVIMDALKQGALSAREAVDLINVVGALTRLTGTIEFIKKMARREVARAAQTLGMEHFRRPSGRQRLCAADGGAERRGGRGGGVGDGRSPRPPPGRIPLDAGPALSLEPGRHRRAGARWLADRC
jgi:Family of unknown function (DUF5681)